MNLKSKFKRLLSGALSLAIIATVLPSIPAAAEEPEKYPYAMFGRNGITISAESNICVNGTVHTNKEAAISYLNGNINGKITTGRDIEKRVKHVYADTKIKETYFTENCDLYEEEYVYSDMNIHINNPLFCYNNIFLDGNVALNSNLGTLMNLNITGEVKNANTSVVYSKYGDITIENDSCANINGLIYAPLGTLTINSPNVNLNGVIIADKIVINGASVNINYKDDIASFIGTESEVYDFSDLIYLPEDWLGDTDKDELFDIYEKVIDTDPLNPDTDGDGLPDGYEVLTLNTDPLEVDTDENGIFDADEDFDSDNLNNLGEYQNKTEPYNPDTDDDGFLDGDEISKYKTDPLNPDTDNDGIKDGDEIKLGLDPLNPQTFGIPDSEYEVSQEVSSDSEAFSIVNTDENPFKLSLQADAAGCVESNITVEESAFSEIIDNDSMIGIAPEFQCEDTCKISKAVVKFKIDTDNLPECQGLFKDEKEFQGIKRYCIFKYDEELNILLPIETMYDEDTNTIYSETDELGTYCVMDMESWLSSDEDYCIDSVETDDTSDNNLNEQELLNEPTNTLESDDGLFDSNEKIVESTINNAKLYAKSVEIIITTYADRSTPVDIVFIIEQVGNNKSLFEQQKKDIKTTAEQIFKMYDDVRIYIIGYNKNSASFYKTSSQNYSTNLTQVSGSLDKIKYTSITGTGNRGTAFNILMKNKYFRDYAAKFTFLIYNNSKQSVVPDGYKNQLDFCISRDVHYSEFMKPWGYTNNGYGRLVKSYITKSDGIIMNDSTSMAQDMYYYILKHISAPTINFNAALPGNIKKIKLNGVLSPNNKVDTDKDGLTDWNEIDRGCGLIKWNSSGNIILPTLREYINKSNKNSAITSIFATYMKYPSQINNKLNTSILPIKSNPCSKDSDGDGFPDKYTTGMKSGFKYKHTDPNPLISDVKEISLKHDFFSVDYEYKVPNDTKREYDWSNRNDNNNASYGGYQGWLGAWGYTSNSKIFCNRRVNGSMVHSYGCGLIAVADMFLYMAIGNPAYNPTYKISTNTMLALGNKYNHIDFDTYVLYISSISDYFTIYNNTLGGVPANILPGSLKSGINTISRYNNMGIKANWESSTNKNNCLYKIKKMINNEIPAVFSYSKSNPLQLYRFKNHAYTIDGGTQVKSHYMVATGIIEYSDKASKLIGHKCMIRIATYGKEYYMDFKDYNPSHLATNIMYVQK